MPVLVTYKFDKDPINNEHASVATSFSHCFSSAQGVHNAEVNDPIRLKFEFI